MKKPLSIPINSCASGSPCARTNSTPKQLPARLDTVHFPLQIYPLLGSVTWEVELNELDPLLGNPAPGFQWIWPTEDTAKRLECRRCFSPVLSLLGKRLAEATFLLPHLAPVRKPSPTASDLWTGLSSSERPHAFSGLRVTVAYQWLLVLEHLCIVS